MPFQFRGRRPDAGRELMQARRSCRGMPTPLVARLLAMVVLHQRSDSLRLSSVFYKAFSNCNSQARKETCLDRATSSSRGNWRSVYNERRYPNRIGPKISRIFAASEAGSQLSSPPKAARSVLLSDDQIRPLNFQNRRHIHVSKSTARPFHLTCMICGMCKSKKKRVLPSLH